MWIKIKKRWNLNHIVWKDEHNGKNNLETYWTRFEDDRFPKCNFRLSRYKLRPLKARTWWEGGFIVEENSNLSRRMSFYEPMQMSILSMLSSKKFHLVISSTLSLSQVTKNDTLAFLKVEVLSDHYRKSLLCRVVTALEFPLVTSKEFRRE